MGNSCKYCFGIQKNNNKYIRSDLAQSRDLSIEFENLMTNSYYDELNVSSQKSGPFTVTSYMQWLSDQEKSFMEDNEDESRESYIPSSRFQSHKIPNNDTFDLYKEKLSQGNGIFRNWCTFGDDLEMCNNRRDHIAVGYFPDELSSDLDPNNPVLYEEEEIDGPELARVIRDMTPRDVFLTGGGQNQSRVLNGSMFPKDPESANLSTICTKRNQNILKGKVETLSTVTSEKDLSSLDLDWDHEPGMIPSQSTKKRKYSEEYLVGPLGDKDLKTKYYYQTITQDSDVIPYQIQNSAQSSIGQNREAHSNVAPPPMPPDQMLANDDLAWDLEEEIFSDDVVDSRDGGGFCFPSSVVPSDRCYLLRD